MANEEQVALLKKGVPEWNEWRAKARNAMIDLKSADLRYADLKSADLSYADLRYADLSEANLKAVDLWHADLSGANLSEADLKTAELNYANLKNANLSYADLRYADLSEAILTSVVLNHTQLIAALLYRTLFASSEFKATNLTKAVLAATVFSDVNFGTVVGLETLRHEGRSSLGMDTLLQSGGNLPEVFLRGVGLPDNVIAYYRSLTTNPVDFYSCFISYSTKDEAFAQRLHNDLQSKGVRCWFAPHDLKAGQKLHEQIDEAIRLHEKLLLILSPNSMDSEWVRTEISKARKRERKENRRVLFPIRLVDFNTLRDWECFDADAGKDSAREIREYYIPDFSNWKSDADEYQREFNKLLQSLKSMTT